jgi:hypothetical protein
VRARHFILAILAIASAQAGLRADPPAPVEHSLFPGRAYDPAVPSPTAFLGYSAGEYHTSHTSMVLYLQALAAASDRMTLDTFGESFERRKLYYAVISSPANLGRIDQIRASLALLAEPARLRDEAQAAEIATGTPAVVLLLYGNDGNETAAVEAALHTAYQLAAATDRETTALLDELVVLVVPAMNPDSHDRFVAWYNAFQVGREGTADPQAAEHAAPWGMNTNNNHYQIDLNRDSVWSTQPESRAMVALYRAWNPQVAVDHHGQYNAFTGPWMVEPLHAELTGNQRDWLRRYGTDMAAIFAEHGYRYTPWEAGQFDPGYWDTFPNFTGAIGFTLETTGGGGRGLRRRGPGGWIWTLKDGVIQHMLADQSVLRLTARHREERLRDFAAYKQRAVDEGRTHAIQAYVLPAGADPQRLDTVVNTLLRNGIEVRRTTAPFEVRQAAPYLRGTAGARSFSAGSYIVPMAQPQARLLRVLMEPEAAFSDAFLKQVDEYRALRDRPGSQTMERPFYDVTAWSLPLTYDLDVWQAARLPDVATEAVTGEVRTSGRLVNPGARHAFVFDATSNHAIEGVARLRDREVLFHVATAPFAAGGHRFRRGTIVVFPDQNPGVDVPGLMKELADRTGLAIVGLDGALVEEGPHLGSDRFVPVERSRIAVVMDGPVRVASYGSIWYLFEQTYGVSFTALSFNRLAGLDLRGYDVLILPDGSYPGLGREAETAIAEQLRRWVAAGGRLIGVKGAAAWLASREVGLSAVQVSDRVGQPPAAGAEAEARVAETVPGTIFRAEVHPQHYLAFGYEEDVPVMVWSNQAFVASPGAAVALSLAVPDRARVSGFALGESIERLAGTPYATEERHGRGRVVLFLDDPNFRLFWDGLSRLFFNAVFLGGSF